jgi:hypothetical protein
MNHYILPGAALIGLVSVGANAAPTPIHTFTTSASAANPSPAGSTGLGPLGAIGGIPGPISFTAPFTGTLVMTVEPNPVTRIFPGDVYQAFVDGTSLGFTSGVELFGTAFTSGTFTTPITAGPNTFNINDQILSYIGFPGPYGSAFPAPNNTVPSSFSPNSVTVILAEELPSAVPEPHSLALLLGSLLGFGFLWRRRNRARPAL